jgi:hypothetical protein
VNSDTYQEKLVGVADISFSDEMILWLDRVSLRYKDFSSEEYRQIALATVCWQTNDIIIKEIECYFVEYLINEGYSKEALEKIEIKRYGLGSWIIEFFIYLNLSVVSTYTFLKGVSELPKIIADLNKLNNIVKQEFTRIISRMSNKKSTNERRESDIRSPPGKTIKTEILLTPAKDSVYYNLKEEIEIRAYYFYQSRVREGLDGSPQDDWLQAEEEVLSEIYSGTVN